MNIASITLTLGWWIVPAIITLITIFGAVKEWTNQDDCTYGMKTLLITIASIAVIAVTWLVYLSAKISLGIN